MCGLSEICHNFSWFLPEIKQIVRLMWKSKDLKIVHYIMKENTGKEFTRIIHKVELLRQSGTGIKITNVLEKWIE